jgi:serine protease Do
MTSIVMAQEPDPSAVVQALERATQSALEIVEPSVVSIGRLPVEGEGPALWGPFGARMPFAQPNWQEFFGTGVILERAGHPEERFVLTNRHVVVDRQAEEEEPARLIVVLPGHGEVPANVIAADPRSDLAVLQLDLASKRIPAADVRAIALGEAEAYRKGRIVLLLGNPYAVARDGSASVATATISNISRSPWRSVRRPLGDEDLTLHHLGTLWHLDARISLGSSGGAVVGFDGRLVGMTTSLAALEGYESSLGYAIPMNAGFRRVVDSLLQGFEVEYGFLGIAPRTSGRQVASQEGAELASAVEVLTVASGSPADQAGLQTGDLITEVNGIAVRNDEDLIREIGLLGPDATATIAVVRPRGAGLTRASVDVRLGKWPVYDDTAILATAKRHEPWRGMEMDYPTARRRYITTQLFERYPQAVVVTRVAPGSPAAGAGLQEGLFISQVNGVPTPTPAEFVAATRDLTGVVTIELDDGRELRIEQ